MLTAAKGPEPKRAMLGDSEEEEDGTSADVRRRMEAEHTEAEFAEDSEDADEEVQAARGLDPLMVYDADSRLGGGETATDQAADSELPHGI